MILLYKTLGKTPLDSIKDLRKKYPDYKNRKLSYAGRLDPMAEGLLLVLIDDENKKRREYEHFDKEYEFEALVGINTDSYDLLGIPNKGKNTEVNFDKVNLFINNNSKKLTQSYPPYSSVKVNGKPLYYWTRKGIEVTVPQKEVIVKKFELIKSYSIDSFDLKKTVFSRVNLVNGDFRQDEILKAWNKFLKEKEYFQILKFRFICSSGGYVRSLVNELGNYLGTGATTFSINRTKIGDLDLDLIKI